jgi:hypothetical protein
MSSANHLPDEKTDPPLEADLVQALPKHGYQGDRAPPSSPLAGPASLTIAISREVGSRGGSIARRAGTKLGWQVYTQELLEYISQESTMQQDIENAASEAGMRWAAGRLEQLMREQKLSRHPPISNLARIVLALGATGEVILLGRGAGSILPAETTLNVRIIAPLADRIAYMSQLLRLTIEEATEQVRLRDQRRAEFLQTHFHRSPGEVYHYDLLLNSSLLGEELCAELIVQAVRAKSELLVTRGYGGGRG